MDHILDLFDNNGLIVSYATEIREQESTRLEILSNDQIIVTPPRAMKYLPLIFSNDKLKRLNSSLLERADKETLAIILNILIVNTHLKMSVSAFHFLLKIGNKGSKKRSNGGLKGGEYFWRLIYSKLNYPKKFNRPLLQYMTTSAYLGIQNEIADVNLNESFWSENYWDVISVVAYYPSALQVYQE